MNPTIQYDRAKLKAVILYTCQRVPPSQLGAVKLHKVLYFLDMIYFALTGSPVTGATYRKRPFGPTCVPLLLLIRDMERAGEIEVRDADYFGFSKKEYIAKAQLHHGVLNASETELLDEVIDFVCYQNSARSISDFSHQLPWEMADFGDVIPYSTALLLFPSQASPEAFERVTNGASEIETARSRTSPVDLPKLSDFRGRISDEIGRRRL